MAPSPRNEHTMSQRREGVQRDVRWRWALAAVVAAILVVTLRPIRSTVAPAFVWCIGCSEFGTLDLLYNVALFVPLGVALGVLRAGVLRALALAAGLSVCIEILQLVVIPGRDPSLSDVITNSLGGALGVPLSRAGAFTRSASRTAWRVAAWICVTLTLALLLLGAWVVAVRVPRTDYFVQWLPQRPGYSAFAGTLESFSTNGDALSAGARIPAAQLPPEFFEGRLSVSARVTPGPSQQGISLIGRLAVEYGEFLMVGRQQDALVVRYRSNAQRLGLRSPIYALPDAFRGDPRGTIELRTNKRGDTLDLEAKRLNMTAPDAARHYQITAARLWATLLPFDRSFGDAGVLGDVLWLALFAALIAFAARRGYSSAWRLVPSIVLVAGIAVVAALMQPVLWGWPAWIGTGSGTLAGSWLGSRPALNRAQGT